jgi:molybdopterin-containing oxidoreductase family iron-sulfur binding subunit
MQSNNAKSKMNSQRREFIGRAGAAAAMLTLAPGVRLVDLALARPADEPASDKVRWGMLVDATKCAQGCTECVEACNEEFGLEGMERPRTDAQYIRKIDLKDKTTGKRYSLPMLCQHCETAPCVDVCPTGASFRRLDGIVLVDKHICIGCRYCMMACPFKARSFVHENLTNQVPEAPRGKGTVEACTFCVHRVDRDREPACVEACTQAGHEALVFGDMNDAGSRLSQRLRELPNRQIRADLGLNTGVRYHGV